ncbi:metallophosphatase family protein [bacterium]|nr:metallophosphatase family protein [bacterium]
MRKNIFLFFFIFWAFSTAYAYDPVDESVISINRFPQNSNVFEDYQFQMQTKAILDPAINGILYPVIGFPAIVTPDEPCFSVIFRYNGNQPFEYVKIIRLDDSGRTEFLNISRYSFDYSNPNFNYLEKIGENIVKLSVCTNILLPEAKYDIALKMTDGEEMISRNALFFPHYEESDPAKFLIVADPQIEDLLSKKTDDMNFNPENYPFYAKNSLINYDQQFGIIKATFSHLNSADTNFSIMLGDIAYGINYQQEYSDFYDMMTKLEIPMFSIPGNHDGYAQFTKVDDLTSPLESDGLEYWAKFLGPMNNAFNFRNRTYLLLNTYDGTPQRRASNQIGIGDTAASPVANWGGYLAEKTLNWAQTILEDYDVAAVFGHMTPLGQDGTGKYHANRSFSKIYGIVSVIDDQEWNFDSSAWDSDVFDGVFNETQTANNGVSLTSFIAQKENPPIYFSGHTHHDKVFTFEKGDELIPNTGVIAPEKMEFIMTTTMATSGSGDYWGFRRVAMSDDEVSYNYSCERYENCGINKSNRGMQSVPAGNLWVSYSWQHGSENKESIFAGGDGTAIKVTAEVVNYLPTEEDVTLRFIMPVTQYGYQLDNENFKIVDAAASSDLSKVVLIVKGKIPAGSAFDAFYNRNFTKFTDSVTISPLNEGELPVPEIEYTDTVPIGNPSTGKVLNADKFSSLIWSLKVLGYPDELYDFASGSSFEYTCYLGVPSDFYLRYTTLTGASGTVQLPVYYYENEEEEPESGDVVFDDDDVVSDDDFVPEDETDAEETEDTDENKPAKKSKGCAITVF